MSSDIRRTILGVLGGAVLLSSLAGCATASHGAGAAPGHSGTEAPRAAWLTTTALVIQTWVEGCAPQISDVVAGDQSIDVTLTRAESGCAKERRAHGTYLGLPAGFDSSKDVSIRVIGLDAETAEIRVPGLASGEIEPADRLREQTPAAAWIAEGELAVLSWGSSSCAPGGGEIDVVSPREGVVTLHEHTDTICTMDMAPRVTFVEAEGLDTDATLRLAGYEDENGEAVVITPVV